MISLEFEKKDHSEVLVKDLQLLSGSANLIESNDYFSFVERRLSK